MTTTGNPVIGLDVALSLEKMRAELRKIPGYATPEGKAMAAAIDKSAKDMAKSLKAPALAAKAAAKESADAWRAAGGSMSASMATASASTKDLISNSSKAKESAASMAAAIGMISPEAGAAVTGIGNIVGVVKTAGVAAEGFGLSMASLTAVLGPVAVAVAALGAAYYYLNGQLEDVEAHNAAQAAGATAMQAAAEKSKSALAEVNSAWDVQTGAISANDAAAKKQVATMREQRAEQEALLAARDTGTAGESDIAARKALAAYRAETETAAEKVLALSAKKDIDAAATDRATAAEKRLAAALAAVARQQAAAIAAAKSNEAALDREADAASAAAAIVAKAAEAEMSASEKLAAQRDADLTAYAEKAQAAGLSIEQFDADRAAIEEGYETQITAATAAEQEKRVADAKEAADKRAAALDVVADRERQIATQIAGYAAQAASQIAESFAASSEQAQQNAADLSERLEAGDAHYTASQKAELQARVEHQRQAALKAFHASQAAAMVTAAINTALAISQALASSPPPYSYALAAASGAAGLIEEAAIASQTPPAFHSGTADTSAYAPDEYQARMRTGEAVANPTGADQIGRSTIAAANAGVAPQTARMEVHMHYRSRDLDPVLSDTYRRGGAFQRTVSANQSKPTGHR